MPFRQEINLQGNEEVVDAMYAVSLEEIYKYRKWLECTEVAYYLALWHFFCDKERHELPGIVQKMLDIHDDWEKDSRIRQAKLEEAERIRKREADARIALKRSEYNDRRQKRSQERDKILKEFMIGSFGDKMDMIAQDEVHLPDYYPFDLKSVSVEDLTSLAMEQLYTLRERFLILKKPEWKQFYHLLLNAIIAKSLPDHTPAGK